MKIETLKIHNIASIEDAMIDFSQSPLADDPLFLITGDTGAGKTTLLNAICLALYNQVPALKTLASKEEDREGLQTNNPRQLLRRGTGLGEVELTFVGNDGKHYRALWSVQRAHKKITGQYQPVKRFLYVREDDDTEVAYTRIDEIQNLILTAVGLTFDQFTRTTLLAQGQFASFMKASDNDKSEILEKLTGTELYTRIGQHVYALTQQKTEEFKAIDNQIRGATLLTEEQKKEMRQHMAEQAKQTERLDAELKTLDGQIDWLREYNRLRDTLKAKTEELKQATGAVASEEYRHARQTVTDWEATKLIRDILSQEKEESRQLDRLERERASLGTTYTTLANGIAWQRAQLQQTRDEQHEVEAALHAEVAQADMYAHAGQIKVLADNVAKAADEHRRLLKERQQAEAEKEKNKRKETAALAAKTEADRLFAAQDEAVKRQETALKDLDLAALTQRVNDLDTRISAHKEAVRRIGLWHDATAEWQEAQRLQTEAQDEQARLQSALQTYEASLPQLKEVYAKKSGFLQGQMELNDHIRELRLRFADTGVCPLCGNREAHLHDDDELSDYLARAKQEEAQAKKMLDQANDSVANTRASLRAIGSTLKSRTAQTTLKLQKKNEAETAAQAAYADYAAADATERLRDVLVQLEALKLEGQRNLETASAQFKTLQSARESLHILRAQKEKADKAIEAVTTKKNMLALHEETLSHQAEQAQRKTDDELASLIRLLAPGTDVTADSALAVSREVERKAADYERRKTRSQQLTEAATHLANQLQDNEAALAGLKDRFVVSAPSRPAERKDLAEAIRQFAAEVSQLDGRIQQTNERREQRKAEAERYFAQPDAYSREAIAALSALTAEAVASCKNQTNAADHRLTAARSAENAFREQMEKHEKARPPMDETTDTPTLLAAKQDKKEEREKAANDVAALRAQLKTDEQQAAQLAEKCRLRDRLRKEKDDWETLDRSFGGADGKKFRNIAQSYVLRALLHKANYYLAMLSNRYRLDCDDGSLTINVIDKHQGDAIRNVGLLSGGEGFVVSLALALGLSSISCTSLNVDTLFIDEGFGTLSSDCLETVITALDRLHQFGGRRVGIISHVEGLKERIPTQIRVLRTGPSSSRVEVVSL